MRIFFLSTCLLIVCVLTLSSCIHTSPTLDQLSSSSEILIKNHDETIHKFITNQDQINEISSFIQNAKKTSPPSKVRKIDLQLKEVTVLIRFNDVGEDFFFIEGGYLYRPKNDQYYTVSQEITKYWALW